MLASPRSPLFSPCTPVPPRVLPIFIYATDTTLSTRSGPTPTLPITAVILFQTACFSVTITTPPRALLLPLLVNTPLSRLSSWSQNVIPSPWLPRLCSLPDVQSTAHVEEIPKENRYASSTEEPPTKVLVTSVCLQRGNIVLIVESLRSTNTLQS